MAVIDHPTMRRNYEPNARKVSQLIFAGLVATVTMVIVAYLLPLAGMPAPDFGALYGSLLNGQVIPDLYSTPWWLGMAWQFVTGVVVFPLVEDYLADKQVLPNFR